MSVDNFKQLVSTVAKKIEDNEKIATPILAAKVAKYIASYPHDQTLGAMSRVLERMAENQKLFIRRGELKDLYSKLYTSNTKFAELFQDELGAAPAQPSVKTYQRDENEGVVDAYQVGDAVLANALNSVFDRTLPLKMYSQPLANQALKSVASTLDTWNLRPTNLTVDEGSEKFLVLKADYETPKGTTSLYIPVEIFNGKVAEAEVFMGNAGPQELNNANVKAYITRFAGSKLKVTAGNILGALTAGTTETLEVSEAEMALIKLNAKRESSTEFTQNQIVGQKIAEASKEVELPKSEEFKSFEDEFTSARGIAAFRFSKANIEAGRNVIIRELSGFGYKNPQVVVSGSNDSALFYGVSLDGGRLAFTVPVKVANNRLSYPSVLVCNGSVSTFSKESVSELALSGASDSRAQAVSSPLYDVKPSELINHIKAALDEGNHSKAEDALNVLANSGDEKAYATGFQMFFAGLNEKKAESAPSTCSRIVKNSTSQHALCGHTGLPLHKVYQDKHGNCLPLYRKGMDETYEGATFMNSKIFG
jgi:hypothetical protein